MPSTLLNSASGLLALLDENDEAVQTVALEHLLAVVADFWPEVFDRIDKIEELYENKKFAAHKTAALLASKVYYHLGEMGDSMQYALGAGDLFDLTERSLYVDTIIARCIDEYIAARVAGDTVDERLSRVADKMFERCFEDGAYHQALGVALEARNLEVVERAIQCSTDVHGMLRYCFHKCTTVVESVKWRNRVLRTIVDLYSSMPTKDHVNVCQCLLALNDHAGVAQLFLDALETKKVDDNLLAYQLAFVLVDNAAPSFVDRVRDLVPEPPFPVEDANSDELVEDNTNRKATKRVREILSGRPTIDLYSLFLTRNCHTDMLMLRNMKNAVDARNSVLHGGIVFANAMMNAGTRRDAFLRRNVDWLKRAANWAKFSAVAAVGVIHKGNIADAFKHLNSSLPNADGGGASSSPYSEGGALFALALVHAEGGAVVIQYLLDALARANAEPVIQHGACLGLGVAAMASGRRDVYSSLQEVLYTLSAVAGEAAAVGMGLTMLGTADQVACEEMLAYAHDTEHEKIIRGLSMGMALIMYGREDAADTMIEQLCRDKDALIRYGGMYTIALAYAGTANNKAIQRLLHVAVSDVSDDVRRAAVTALGFLLFRKKEQCPRVVSLLSQSYNAHVRYGAAMALGVACAGTGMKEALDLLEPLREDMVDYVRQGALIATSMVLLQCSAEEQPLVKELREKFTKILGDKHEPLMCKLGAAYAGGILEAGGRNVSITLESPSGQRRCEGIVGLALFLQHWSWYPFSYFMSMAFQPTALIGVNEELEMPEFQFTSAAKPSLFAYPEMTMPEVKKKGEKVKTAVLSTTKKRARLAASGVSLQHSASHKAMIELQEAEEEEEKKMKEEAEKKKKEAEEAARIAAITSEMLSNPARVTPRQLPHLRYDVDARYTPITTQGVYGVVVLKDGKPTEPLKKVNLDALVSDKVVEPDVPEAECPPPFVFDPSKEE